MKQYGQPRKGEDRMLVGYARVSTYEQNLDLQMDALRQHGCEKIFTDRTSGGNFARKGLEEALNYMRPGDTLVVWKWIAWVDP
jgi:DNA invertase Pin-like site-specific DNA recombinase